MKIHIKRVVFLVLIILNCITIFYFSHQIANNSSKQSSRVVEIVSNIVPFIKNMQEPNKTILKEGILSTIIRKTAHFSIYAMLGIFTINFVVTISNKNIHKNIIYTILFCFIYAITDEFHQSFIPGRSAEIRDVLIDTLGALTGILVVIVITKLLTKIKKLKYAKK